jgi:transcriptional regulator with XRE-family HTH domain
VDIIDQLERFRLENRVTQQTLAAKLGVAFSTVNRWLNRKSYPRKIQSYHIQKLIEAGKRHAKNSKQG